MTASPPHGSISQTYAQNNKILCTKQHNNLHKTMLKQIGSRRSFRLECATSATSGHNQLKAKLASAGESSHLFGIKISHKFESIIGGIYQTFGDGNKRIGSVLFIYYLEKNGYLFRLNGERKITDNTIVALALLIAKSDPGEKDVMIGIITNLIK